ncbi:MAG: hypothetical protein ACI9R3_002479 [Verrucomicrobiales bacterium]|jgi:hypothetical protein
MTTDSEPNKESIPPKTTKPSDGSESEDSKQLAAPPSADMSAASFWDESQIQQVIRHAGSKGRSPQEFFNKKWKEKFIHKKSEDGAPSDEAK